MYLFFSSSISSTVVKKRKSETIVDVAVLFLCKTGSLCH